MIFINEHDRSLLPKSFIIAVFFYVILIASWLMVADAKGIYWVKPYKIFRKKIGKDFKEYAKRTKKFIPMIY